MGEILFLAHRIPFPPDRGDKIRAHHLLNQLAKIAPVHVGCFGETEKDFAAEPELAAVAETHCLAKRSKPLVLAGAEAVLAGKPVSLTAFHSHKLEAWVRETIASQAIDTIVIFSGQMGQYVPDDFAGRVLVDLCDVDSVKFEDYAAAGERVWLNRREGRLLASEEERLVRRADAVTLISENEVDVLRSRLTSTPGQSIHAFGNGIDYAFFDPAKVGPHPEIATRPGPHFVFSGQMDYRPNELAALWAIRSFLPAAQAKHPDAEFHVVGRNPTDALQQAGAAKGVTIWGEVPDVRPFIAAADMVVVPLTIARGVQNKVLEAMAMAKPIMLTREAATGISATNNQHWLVEQADAGAMVSRFEAAWADRAGLDAMARSAREFVLEQHGWDTVLKTFDALVRGEGQARHAA